MDPAVIAVIASGFVAVVAIVAPILTTLIADSLKWRREQRATEAKSMAKSTIEVLDALASYRSGDIKSATQTSIAMAYSDLLSKFYTWELAILASSGKVERQKVSELRRELEASDYRSLYGDAPKFADKIIEIARSASTKRGWLDESTED